MSMNKTKTILTLLVLLGTTITAQAWDRGKVERFFREHENHVTIQRLRSNRPISAAIAGIGFLAFCG